MIEAIDKLLGPDNSDLYNIKDNGKYMLDLSLAVKRRFIQLGVPEDKIDIVGGCTLCNPDIYYSHRFGGPARGSLASAICLK